MRIQTAGKQQILPAFAHTLYRCRSPFEQLIAIAGAGQPLCIAVEEIAVVRGPFRVAGLAGAKPIPQAQRFAGSSVNFLLIGVIENAGQLRGPGQSDHAHILQISDCERPVCAILFLKPRPGFLAEELFRRSVATPVFFLVPALGLRQRLRQAGGDMGGRQRESAGCLAILIPALQRRQFALQELAGLTIIEPPPRDMQQPPALLQGPAEPGVPGISNPPDADRQVLHCRRLLQRQRIGERYADAVIWHMQLTPLLFNLQPDAELLLNFFQTPGLESGRKRPHQLRR